MRDQVPVSQVNEKTQGAYVRATLSRGNWVVVMLNCMRTYGGTGTTLLALVRLVVRLVLASRFSLL